MNRLKEMRILAGYSTAKEFAKSVGFPYSTYARYEAGKGIPTVKDAAIFAELLGCKLSDLVESDMPDPDFDPGKNELTQLYARLSSHDQAIILNMARFMAQNSGNQTNIQDATITGSTIITGDGNTVNNSSSGNDYTDNRQNITINNYSSDKDS